MKAKIYSPAKTAMQSGKGNTHNWVLEFNSENSRTIEPLMGWTSNSDTKSELKIKFKNLEDATRYASENSIEYVVVQPKKPRLIKQAYAENFTA